MPQASSRRAKAPAWASSLRALLCLLGLLSTARPAGAAAPTPPERRAAVYLQRALEEAARGEVQALPDLLRASEHTAVASDLGELDALLAKIAAAPRARADVRAAATHLRVGVAQARGQLPRARELADGLAPVRRWAVLGPFANEGKSGFGTAYGPEKDGVELRRSYPGKDHVVAWQAMPEELAPWGEVSLSGAIAPHQDVVAYAATWIRSAGARTVRFHLGAAGGVKVWVNGRLVHEDPAQHPARFDQESFPAALQAGENEILIKIAHGSGPLGLTLRLADGRTDAPLPAVARTAQSHRAARGRSISMAGVEAGRPPGGKAPARLEARRGGARDLLERRAEAAPKDARAQDDLAVYLALRRPDDDDDRAALAAAQRAAATTVGRSDPAVALRLAALEDRDGNRRRAALETALAAHPDDAELLGALARHRLERGEPWLALGLAERARAAAPGSVAAALLLAQAQDGLGLGGRAFQLRLDTARQHPGVAAARKAAGFALRHLGRLDEAERELRAALEARFTESDARAELAQMDIDRGDLPGALGLLAEDTSLAPAAVGPRLHAASLLSTHGQTARADAAFAALVALAPNDADVHEELGRHRLRAKDEKGALAAFDRALALRPQNPALRELVRSVKPEDRYAAPYLYDAAKLVKLDPLTGEDDELLADLTVTKVFPNGLSSRTHQVVWRALTQRGAEQIRVQSAHYSPDRQMVTVERARILRKEGTVLESRSEGERSVSEPWYGLYYDVRARIVSFPQLQPGDTFELITRLDDSGSNFFADYFGDLAYLQGTSTRRHADYVLLGPPGRTFYATAKRVAPAAHSEGTTPDGGTWQRWSMRDVARVIPEPSMPGLSELFAYVHVSTYGDWESVGRFYWGLVKDQLRVTDDIRNVAGEAVRGIPASDEPARIRALYDYVVSRTRYVGLEFGIHSFKPYPVDVILGRRFGDCKDKASLLHALLESQGIDSRLVLLRMKHLGAIDEAPASLAVFNHAILYVPKYQLFLDGTAEFHGSTELPGDDHGAEVLVVEPSGNGSRFFRVPESAPQDNTATRATRARLAPDGSAELDVTSQAHGSSVAEQRRTYLSPDGRERRAEEQLARSYPGVHVTRVEVSDPAQLERPFRVRIQARADQFASRAAGAGLRFSPFGRGAQYVESMAALSRRALPQMLPEPRRSVQDADVELPAGWAATVPEDAHAEGPDGSFKISYERRGQTLHARLELELRGGMVAPKQYPTYRSFLTRLDAALLRMVEAGPAAKTAANERH